MSQPLQNSVSKVNLQGQDIVCLMLDGNERLCLAQISNTLLKQFSYNEIHNRRVALGITCVQCTPVQLEILRRAGAMPVSSRRCGMISKREAERLVKSFLDDSAPPKLPDDFVFDVKHSCGWGGRGVFIPARYNSSRAKCIQCTFCNMYFSPNKFIFHFHRTADASYNHPDAANFNSWRRHLILSDPNASDHLSHLWEDVKAMFNGGTRKRTYSIMSTKQHKIPKDDSSKKVKIENSPAQIYKPSHYSPLLPHNNNNNNVITTPSAPSNKSYPMFPANQQTSPYTIPAMRGVDTMPHQRNGEHLRTDLPPHRASWSLPGRQEVGTSYYPPYEMIWANHLGLRLPEDGFARNMQMVSPDSRRTDETSDARSDTSSDGDFSVQRTPPPPPPQTTHAYPPQKKVKHNFTDVSSLISSNDEPDTSTDRRSSSSLSRRSLSPRRRSTSVDRRLSSSDHGSDNEDVDVDGLDDDEDDDIMTCDSTNHVISPLREETDTCYVDTKDEETKSVIQFQPKGKYC